MPRIKLFFDGGSRPAGMETAVVVGGRAYVERELGPGTNVDAEWLALIQAVRLAQRLSLEDVVFLGDSATVVAQSSGKARARGSSANHLDTFAALAAAGAPHRVRYIKRSQNLAGIALAHLHERGV